MQCLTDNGSGSFTVTTPQPDTYTTCVSILVTPTELQSEIFNLTNADGALIGGSIILVWAVAFGFRAMISTLNSNERELDNE